MNVEHILLRQPWIEHLDVNHEEGDIYSVKHGSYTIKLIPAKGERSTRCSKRVK